MREPAYMHSFGLTERWFVLAEFPFVVNPLRLALSGRPYIENYRWKPELRHAIHADRPRDRRRAAAPFEAEPGSPSTTSTRSSDDGDVVADICVYADAGVIDDLYLDRLRAGRAGCARAALRRFRISPGSRHGRASSDLAEPTSSWRGSTTGAATSARTATRGATARPRAAGSSGS